jgi:inner membrane protein
LDPPTHGLLGAALGQALFGRTLGRRALAWGAFGAMLPDVDVVMNATGPMSEWLYHRGPTHALWVPPLVGTLLGTAIGRARQRRDPEWAGPIAHWRWLFVLTLLSHPLLDAGTSYGTVLFAPFWNHRFAIEAIAIVDPLFSLLFVMALLVGLVKGVGSREARVAGGVAFALATAYLAYGLQLSHEAESRARAQLAEDGIRATRVDAYHAPLQLYLHRLVARDADEVRVGWLSLWHPRRIEWRTFRPAQGPLVEEARRTPEGRLFEWFTFGQNAATLTSVSGVAVVEIDDLRFGLPSEPQRGLWAIRVRLDDQGRPIPPVDRVDRPLPVPAPALLRQIWRQAFGG